MLYQQCYDDEGDGDNKKRSKISVTALYSIMGGSLVVVWLVSFTAFINKKYLHTFVGTMQDRSTRPPF